MDPTAETGINHFSDDEDSYKLSNDDNCNDRMRHMTIVSGSIGARIRVGGDSYKKGQGRFYFCIFSLLIVLRKSAY